MTKREALKKIRENSVRMRELNETAHNEKRAMSAEEQTEFDQLEREKTFLENSIKCEGEQTVSVEKRSVDQMFRSAYDEAVNAGRKPSITLQLRASLTTAQGTEALEGTGLIPVDEMEMLEPIRAGLIWNKVGIRIASGKHMRWPKHGKLVAAFLGEKEKIVPGAVDWDAVESVRKRLGLACIVTRQEVEESNNVVANVITSELPAAIIDKVNDALFATSTEDRVIWGPFAEAGTAKGCGKIEFKEAIPTRAEILKMKAKIAKAGVAPSQCCWVMTETMKAQLEDVKVDAGSGRFLVEEDRMLGYPIYCTDAIGDTNIGFGDWSYFACNLDAQNIIFDPYTEALADSFRFVDNSDVTFAFLRPEAFVLGFPKVAQAG